MDQESNNSGQNPSISRDHNGQKSRRDDPIGNKDIPNRTKCPNCDGRLSKESNKSKSRVWKRVMWFTRRSKAPKNDVCQCQTGDSFINCNVEDRHSNSWSFTRSASRKFRISSRKRQCKSESSKKSLRVVGKQDEACTSYESSLSSAHRGSICSSGANSPTATGSFCDFGASSHAGGRRGSKKHKNTFVLTEIAREINPPVRNDDLKLGNIHHPPKQLTKSSSSVSHLSRNCTSPKVGNVRRSKSFPGSQNLYISPAKRRFTSTSNKAFVTFSPPVKQRCYGLRRTATYCGKLNTEFPKLCMKKSKSVNNGELLKHGKSTSLGEIRDQSGSVVGIVHFYKSPKKMARRVSSFIHEVKKDCMFEEEEFRDSFVNQTSPNVSQKSSRTCLNTDSMIFKSQQDAAESSSVNETSQRNDKETRSEHENTASYKPSTPSEETLTSIVCAEDSLCFSNMSEEKHNVCTYQDKPTLCNAETGVLSQKDFNNINASGSNYVGINNGEVDVLNCNQSSKINDGDFHCTGAGTENVNDIEDISECEPSSMKDKSFSSTLPSEGEMGNISSLQTVSKTVDDSSSLAGSQQTEPPSSVASQQSSENESEYFDSGDHHHGNQLRPELHLLSPTCKQTSEDGELPCCHDEDDHSRVCDHDHRNNLETEPPSSTLATLDTAQDFKLSYQDNVSDEYNENQLSTEHEVLESLEDEKCPSEKEYRADSFTKYQAKSCSDTSSDRFLQDEIYVDSSSFPEMIEGSVSVNDGNTSDDCLEGEVEITEQLDSLTAREKRDLTFCNNEKLTHKCPCIMCKDDLTLEVFDNQINIHSSMTTSSETKPNSPTIRIESANDPLDLYKENETDISCPENCGNSRSLAMPVMACEEIKMCRHSSGHTSPDVLECSKTSDYISFLDESFSAPQTDVPIHTWKTSELDLKSDEIGLPVPGETFKRRTELMLSWFEEFNDEQRNIILKKILNCCELPQMHLLSVTMENNLHKTCPPNCQDMLVWLPYTVTLKILMYLDPVSLCRCGQVNRAWNELTDNSLLWQRLTRNPDHQLSEASRKRQYQKFTQGNGEIHWKKVFAERFLLQRNWLNGTYKLRTFEGHSQGIACVQFDDTRIVSGSSDKTIKLWDISNTPSELMLTLEGHSGTVRCLDLNGNRLVSGSTDRTIKVWDLSFASYWAGASCKVTMVGHLHTVRCLQADGKKLVSGSYDKTVKVWDLKNGECQLTLRGHTAAVLCVQFDDQKIVSGSYDKKIKVWDLTEGTCLMTLDGHQDAVTCLNLTHDGMKIITGSLDYSLKFWDLSTGKCYGTLDWITSEGHTAVVRCLQVDSWRIVSGGDDKTLKVWELATGQRLLTLRYHSDGVTCMQFNDFAIVSGSYDRTVKLWDFTPKHSYLEAVT